MPNGVVFTTPEDMAYFANTLMKTSSFLKDASKNNMVAIHTPASTAADVGYHYGLGFKRLTTKDYDVIIGHGGGVAGYHAALYL